MKAIRRFTVRTVLPPELVVLDKLARNLRWCWDEPTFKFFASLDPEAWERIGHDPVALLGEISPTRINQLAADPYVVDEAQQLGEDLDRYLTEDKWFQADFQSPSKPRSVAYFSAEYGITSAMPQYSGGLGILAGDHLKSASDLGVPVTGVGLLYGAGYFRQSLSRDGWQRETYPLVDPHNLPLTLLREDNGSAATVSLQLPQERSLTAQIWVAQVGRVPLLLLDSNVPENDDESRAVTDRLYSGSVEHRLEQELLLGIGGVRALRIYQRLTGAPSPEVYHCNEGHAGFISVERIRELVESETPLGFGAAVEAVRSANLFTTHTPVPAGIDRFPRSLVASYLASLELPGDDVAALLELGAETLRDGDPKMFNMAIFGLRMSRAANGVSQLHGEVSRRMFTDLWPGFSVGEVPITHITNGVHGPTWRNFSFEDMARQYMSAAEAESGAGWKVLEADGGVPDAVIWGERCELRAKLVREARLRLRESWLERGATAAEVTWTDTVLDPNILTIGFMRRVPSYKRLTLMLDDPERLTKILTDPDRPVQLVVAGKSHPADEQGVSLIQKLVRFADNPAVRDRIVFLPNYDMAMAQAVIPGCDVWLNNPLRPFEASGTSGMKSALNGALNLSVLDGWWAEMYDGSNGWVIPSAEGVQDPQRRDELEAGALYDLIESTVVPRFYEREANGIPRRWLEMVRHTLATLGPKVQATRMVRDYVRELYTPIAASARVLDAAPYEAAAELAQWKQKVKSAWQDVEVDFVEASVPDVAELGDRIAVKVGVSLGSLGPEDVAVQLISGRVGEKDELEQTAISQLRPAGRRGAQYLFVSQETLNRSGSMGYAVRAVPSHPLLGHYTDVGLSAVASPAAVAGHTHTSTGQ